MHKPLRSRDVRESNEKLVLNLIFTLGRASQSLVVQRTGLKAPTVYRIFSKLQADGFIRSCTKESPTPERKGRRPNVYCVEPDSGYAIGVDFSRLSASVIVVNFANQMIYHHETELPSVPDRETILSSVQSMVAEAIARSGVGGDALLGMGIAAPGVVDTETGRVVDYRRIDGLSGYPLQDRFEERFGVPVFVHNNASVIASGAYHYGVAREADSLLTILVRFGVGAALVTQGSVFLNGTTTALEFGRTTLNPESVETTARDKATLEQVIAEGPLLERLRERCAVSSWEEAEDRLSQTEVARALHAERLQLGAAVRNLHHLFHPEMVLLVTRFHVLSNVLGDAVRAVLPEREVVPVVYDPVQACFGATDMVFGDFFSRTSQDDSS
jgi:predicted NBD/HSP70 family sugar kinase